MAEFLKSQSPQELWKAALKPKDPFKPDDPAKPASLFESANAARALPAAKAPGTGVALDITA